MKIHCHPNQKSICVQCGKNHEKASQFLIGTRTWWPFLSLDNPLDRPEQGEEPDWHPAHQTLPASFQGRAISKTVTFVTENFCTCRNFFAYEEILSCTDSQHRS
jgi:hypothetical protein